ncbi:MAG: chromate transporter [Ruminococcaceae bacterium]|nr:chromate transporter [Oscillospiraceae bacterium]
MKTALELFWVFLRVGAMTFGGGYAMLPILQRELVEKRQWVTDEDLTDYYAIGQCTPGIIALNVSTFIGRSKAGLLGAITAAVGFELVPLIIILIISLFLEGFSDNEYVQHALAGINVCVCVLILNTLLKLRKSTLKGGFSLVIFFVVFALAAMGEFLPFSIPLPVLVIAAAATGIIAGQIKEQKKAKGGNAQ